MNYHDDMSSRFIIIVYQGDPARYFLAICYDDMGPSSPELMFLSLNRLAPRARSFAGAREQNSSNSFLFH